MQEIPDNGASSTSKCGDTTDANILNTSDATVKPSSKPARTTKSKPRASVTSDFNAKSEEPPPRYLFSELHRLTFTVGETSYRADDTEHTFLWMKFVQNWANVKGSVDWDDLEERAHFLNKLYVFCEQNNVPFPLTEEPENINDVDQKNLTNRA